MAGTVYEGKSFDEAVRKGLEALKLSRAEAVITTIEEGKSGFLGLGSRPYRVSVARRPGGAIREPVEREERVGRGGRRGGREERGGRREERAGRPAREQQAQGRGNREERGPREERAGRPAREEGRGGRPAREERRERPREMQGAGARDEQRPAREERGGREERGREERAGREARPPREERRERAPREERREQPVAQGGAPVPPAVSEGGDESPRKRRRRGRRGGRGRRRGGSDEGEPMVAPSPSVTGNGSEHVARLPEEPMTPQPLAFPEHGPEHGPEHAPEPMAAEPLPMRVPESAPAFETAEPEPAAMAREDSPREPREPRQPRERREPREDRSERGRYGHREREERRERAPGEERGEGSRAPELSSDELGAASRRLTEELLRAMGFEPRVGVRVEGNRVDITVEVDRDDDLLNGRQGETRLALQHLLNRFLNKGDGSRYHLQLEVNDFWQQREGELAELAHKLADEAIATNAEVVSDYLNSQERRIVHVTLKEDSRVRTFSLGTGMVKRVAVAPASFPERTEDDSTS